jgi:hypothetical protein
VLKKLTVWLYPSEIAFTELSAVIATGDVRGEVVVPSPI